MGQQRKLRLNNATAFRKWIEHGKLPVLRHSLKLYNKLLGLHYKIVLITERSESQRKITVKNLRDAGYHQYTKIIFKQEFLLLNSKIVYMGFIFN
ncbi:hypothetical protein Lal_00023521 [Lupinus albus]|nr:hypothetical protein Lal_00023521 [Lupinus albus]